MVAANQVPGRPLRLRVRNIDLRCCALKFMSAVKRHKVHRRKRQKLRAIDLFSGCGGLTLGLKQAGFRVIGAIEIDSLAVETYKRNHHRVRVWAKDIRSVRGSEIRRLLKVKKGQLDLLAGCPPCQGFSRMTTLNGKRQMRDARNNLVFEFIRFVRALKPKAVMMENVPGLAQNRRMREIRRQLETLGYRCTHQILNAKDYAVPQRRRRLILVAGHGNAVPLAPKARTRRTVRHAFRQLRKRTSKDPLHALSENRSAKIAAMIRSIPKNGGSRSDLDFASQLTCHTRCDGFRDVYGRMKWDDVAPTITTGCVNPSKGRFLHPVHNRCITLREAALLQGFPPGYYFSLRRGKFAAAQMIGNALPPEFIRRHANQLARYLREQIKDE